MVKKLLLLLFVLSITIATKSNMVYADESYTFSYRNTEYQSTKTLTESNDYMQQLKQLETITKDKYSLLDELTFIRNNKYHSSEWKLLAGTLNNDLQHEIEDTSDNILDLQKESFVHIQNSEYIVKPVHLAGTINCLKNGAGSIGGWKGDLCELIETIDRNENKIYEKAYKNFSMEESVFGIYDVYTDMAAVNISSILPQKGSYAEAFENYCSYIPYFNQYALFVKNEFKVDEINKETLRQYVKNSFKNDVYVSYLLNQKGISDNDVRINETCNAFADFILENISNYNLNEELKGIQIFENKKEKKVIARETTKAEIKMKVKMLKKYLSEVK